MLMMPLSSVERKSPRQQSQQRRSRLVVLVITDSATYVYMHFLYAYDFNVAKTLQWLIAAWSTLRCSGRTITRFKP